MKIFMKDNGMRANVTDMEFLQKGMETILKDIGLKTFVKAKVLISITIKTNSL